MPLRLPTLAIACLVLALLLTVMCAITRPARSQSAVLTMTVPCGPADDMASSLRKFGQEQLGEGTNPDGVPMVMNLNPKTGSFSMLLVMPDGTTCLITAGKNFRVTGKVIPGQAI